MHMWFSFGIEKWLTVTPCSQDIPDCKVYL